MRAKLLHNDKDLYFLLTFYVSMTLGGLIICQVAPGLREFIHSTNTIGTGVEKETFTWSLDSGISLFIGQETVTIKDQTHSQ